MHEFRLVIITGLSGAGKSQAARALEDLGFFCIDNLPPTLLPKLVELCGQTGGSLTKVALVIDVRGRELSSLDETLASLDAVEAPYSMVFLEADAETLVRRFKETRRAHPLSSAQGGLMEAVAEERRLLAGVRAKADIVIDTSDHTPQRLRQEIGQLVSGDWEQRLVVHVVTFGYKHGVPLDADLVFDVRFLPNPHYVEALRPLDGHAAQVQSYVMRPPVAKQLVRRLVSLVQFMLPHFGGEGRTDLVIAIGCTGGYHRSVVVSLKLAAALRKTGHRVVLTHRDLELNPRACPQ